MTLDRRTLLTGPTVTGAVAPIGVAYSATAPGGGFGMDVTKFGVRPNSVDDQSRALQEAINVAAGSRVPLFFPPGVYRAGDLALPSGTHLVGVPGASRMLLGYGASLAASSRAEQIMLAGLVLRRCLTAAAGEARAAR